MQNHPYYNFDDHRLLAFPGDHDATINFAADEWIRIANDAIDDHKFFAVALSGGSTPYKIYQKLASKENVKKVDWERVYFFWSDERPVNPDSPESNYKMAMDGFKGIDIPQKNVFRMMAEKDIHVGAEAYCATIEERLKGNPFDLIMLGMGEDGHTASLFPKTHGLHEDQKNVIANFIPQIDSWRMSFTYKCINEANHIHIYVLGKNKARILEKVFTETYNPIEYPVQKVGNKRHSTLWIIDEEAGQNLVTHLE